MSTKKKVAIGVGAAIAVFVVLGLIGGASDDDESTATVAAPSTTTADAPEPILAPTTHHQMTQEVTAPATTEAVELPAPAKAPTVLSLPLAFAESKNGDLKFEARDIAGDLGVPGVAKTNGGRGIFDRANWSVVAQCDQLVDGKVEVGVVKTSEKASIPGIDIANNNYALLLDCN
ncbi:hypothetical protein ACWDUM_19165 [Rhodococcus sp. NPDC003322]